MSAYKKQELDFVYRTKEILKQYDGFQITKAEKYEITLLLNCFVGLLILPQQHWFDKLPEDHISRKEWGIAPEHISTIKDGETKNVKDIARHLRNSISHYTFKVFGNRSGNISNVTFKDFDKQKSKTFEASIPIQGIRQFVTKLSDVFIYEIDKQKP